MLIAHRHSPQTDRLRPTNAEAITMGCNAKYQKDGTVRKSRLEITIREDAVHIKAKFKTNDKNTEITTDMVIFLIKTTLITEKSKLGHSPFIYTHVV